MGTCFKTYQMHPRLQRIFFSPLSNSLGAGVLGSLFGFCGVPEKALIQPFSLSDSILTLNFELVRKTDVANWKTSLESHYLKKNSSLRSFVKEHTDNGKTTEPAGFKQAFRDMSTYNKKPSCIANLLIYFTRRGLARMCFFFTVIATLVS